MIPFTKAHGAKNDFLLTWDEEAPRENRPELARAICDRHTGIGADGWLLVTREGAITLYNSDGSAAEMSGNGTRCAAAFLVRAGLAGETIRIVTGAGPKTLRQLDRSGLLFSFEMNMGAVEIRERSFPLDGRDVTLMWVGNPQCAVPVPDFEFDWRALGAAFERHPHFPNRTNVSFLRALDRHTLEVRFWERGAGETMSSGTGSTGAVAAALARGLVESPVRVLTPAGPLDIVQRGAEFFLTGPAEIIADGEYLIF